MKEEQGKLRVVL